MKTSQKKSPAKKSVAKTAKKAVAKTAKKVPAKKAVKAPAKACCKKLNIDKFIKDFFKKTNLVDLIEDRMIVELKAMGLKNDCAKKLVSKFEIDLGVVEGNITIIED